MAVQTERVTREQVLQLARAMPLEKLAHWYEYGLFLQSHPLFMPNLDKEEDTALQSELTAWEAASDEDWAKLEEILVEAA